MANFQGRLFEKFAKFCHKHKPDMEKYSVLPTSTHTASVAAYKWLISDEESFVNALLMLNQLKYLLPLLCVEPHWRK